MDRGGRSPRDRLLAHHSGVLQNRSEHLIGQASPLTTGFGFGVLRSIRRRRARTLSTTGFRKHQNGIGIRVGARRSL